MCTWIGLEMLVGCVVVRWSPFNILRRMFGIRFTCAVAELVCMPVLLPGCLTPVQAYVRALIVNTSVETSDSLGVACTGHRKECAQTSVIENTLKTDHGSPKVVFETRIEHVLGKLTCVQPDIKNSPDQR